MGACQREGCDRRRDSGALSVTTDRAKLGAGKTPAGTVQVLFGEAQKACGRIVELQGPSPFDAVLEWSAGQGMANKVKISVPRATRVCVHARTLRVVVANQSSLPKDVNVAVSDGFTWSRNFLELSNVGNDAWQPYPVPAFALSVRPDLESPLNAPNAFLRLVNGFGDTTALSSFADLPPMGLALGLSEKVEAFVPSVGTSGKPGGYRLSFELGL